jgi:hypothetical protein
LPHYSCKGIEQQHESRPKRRLRPVQRTEIEPFERLRNGPIGRTTSFVETLTILRRALLLSRLLYAFELKENRGRRNFDLLFFVTEVLVRNGMALPKLLRPFDR